VLFYACYVDLPDLGMRGRGRSFYTGAAIYPKPEVQSKIQELIKSYDPIHRINMKTSTDQSDRDPRLPMPGSFITKTYKGNRLEVKVLESGFEYQGTIYKNLSAVAKTVTGAHWNGFAFFGVKNNGRK
jgi:hypothetical protein